MGTQRPVVIGLEEAPFGGEEPTDELGGPIAEHHGKKKLKTKSSKLKVEQKIKEAKFKKESGAEIAKEEKSVVKELEKKEEVAEKPAKKAKVGKAKVRSKKYKEAVSLIDQKKIYSLSEAIELAKKTTLSKFDGNLEAHIRILSKTGKPEIVRGTLKYPHSTGKKIKVVILDEKKIEEIEKTKKIDFDVALSSPEMMPKVAKLAKILGPKGKMPNPKSGTVTAHPEKTKEELEGGLSEYRTDSYGIIHQVMGKVSFDEKDLEENIKALLAVLPIEKIDSFHICATMGPSVKVLTRSM